MKSNQYPLIPTAEEIQAIRDGRQTQFRRVMKPQPPNWLTGGRKPWNIAEALWGFGAGADQVCHAENMLRCPYGQPGDLIRACSTCDGGGTLHWMEPDYTGCGPPRCPHCIWLRNKAVRAERLQEISKHDVVREGLFTCCCGGERDAYREAWDSLNERGHLWEDDPWVWIIDVEMADDPAH